MEKKTISDYKELEIKHNITFLNLEDKFPKNVSTKTKVKCNNCNFGENNEWDSFYSYFTLGHQCPKCIGKYRKRIEDYIELSNKANITLFDLQTNFPKNNQTPVKSQCKKCKYIWQISFESMQKERGCPNCAGVLRKTIKDYEDLIKDKDIILPDINNNLPESVQTKTKAICKKCNHEWKTTYNRISCDRKCPNCRKVKYEDYISLSKEKNLIFLDFKAPPKNCQTPIRALCNKCEKEWYPNYNGLKCGKSCPNCLGFRSGNGRGEHICRNILNYIFKTKFHKLRKASWLKNPKTNHYLELDGYSEDLKLAFEYQGYQHFKKIKSFNSNLISQQFRDDLKLKICNANNIKLIIVNQYKYLTFKHIYNEMKKVLVYFNINDEELITAIELAILK